MRRRDLLGGLAAAPFARGTWAATDQRSVHDTAVVRLAAESGFAGVVMVGHRGKPSFARAIGLASVEANTPATIKTRYAIGSVSKWLTTTAVLRLVDHWILSLDAAISTYLPWLPGQAGKVPLRYLLSNTSGIPDRLVAAIKVDASWRRSDAVARDVVRRFVPGDLAFAPGARFDYAVLNWVIVRAVMEERTGRPFAALIDELVIEPVGLPNTGIAEHGFDRITGLAPAYARVAPPMRKMDPVPAFAAASGSFFANAGDLLRAAHVIFGPALLSASAREAMLTVQVPDEDYALGGRVRTIAGRRWAWETGKTGGYRAHLAHDVAADRTIVVLGNTDTAQSSITTLVEDLADA